MICDKSKNCGHIESVCKSREEEKLVKEVEQNGEHTADFEYDEDEIFYIEDDESDNCSLDDCDKNTSNQSSLRASVDRTSMSDSGIWSPSITSQSISEPSIYPQNDDDAINSSSTTASSNGEVIFNMKRKIKCFGKCFRRIQHLVLCDVVHRIFQFLSNPR